MTHARNARSAWRLRRPGYDAGGGKKDGQSAVAPERRIFQFVLLRIWLQMAGHIMLRRRASKCSRLCSVHIAHTAGWRSLIRDGPVRPMDPDRGAGRASRTPEDAGWARWWRAQPDRRRSCPSRRSCGGAGVQNDGAERQPVAVARAVGLGDRMETRLGRRPAQRLTGGRQALRWVRRWKSGSPSIRRGCRIASHH
jgi:hypothetical protein